MTLATSRFLTMIKGGDIIHMQHTAILSNDLFSPVTIIIGSPEIVHRFTQDDSVRHKRCEEILLLKELL